MVPGVVKTVALYIVGIRVMADTYLLISVTGCYKLLTSLTSLKQSLIIKYIPYWGYSNFQEGMFLRILL